MMDHGGVCSHARPACRLPADELEAAKTLSALAGFCQELAAQDKILLDLDDANPLPVKSEEADSGPDEFQATKKRKHADAAPHGGLVPPAQELAAVEPAPAPPRQAEEEEAHQASAVSALGKGASSYAGIKMQDVLHLLHLSHLSSPVQRPSTTPGQS